MCRDEPDRFARGRLHGDTNAPASHGAEGSSVIVDLDCVEVRRKREDVIRLGDRLSGEPRNTNVPRIRMVGYSPMPGTLKVLNEILEGRRVADLLESQDVRSLGIDGRRQSLDLSLVDGLRRGAGRGTWPEQVLDVPCQYLKHGRLL